LIGVRENEGAPPRFRVVQALGKVVSTRPPVRITNLSATARSGRAVVIFNLSRIDVIAGVFMSSSGLWS
jgi:hypothetical protein